MHLYKLKAIFGNFFSRNETKRTKVKLWLFTAFDYLTSVCVCVRALILIYSNNFLKRF